MSGRDKAINYLSMILSGIIGVTVAYVIYRQTMEHAVEIARQGLDDDDDRGGSALLASASRRPEGLAAPDYADIEAGPLDREDAATLMDDDDLSLWDAPESAYRDNGDSTPHSTS